MDTVTSNNRLHDDELYSLLLLMQLPGVGEMTLRRLLERYGAARNALGAHGLPSAARAARDDVALHERVRRGVAQLNALHVQVLRQTDHAYPQSLHHLHDPPVMLFARGDLSLLARPCAAIVGTRRCTEYGIEAASLLASGLARAGVVVVSGLARGIDGIAHETALAHGGGTVALLGTGIDVAYPPEHGPLQERVAGDGLLLTEVPPGMAALPHHFPKRNRLIAALSRAVIVVEAGKKSGALLTADSALELGREVLAVPGPIGRASSEGVNALLRQGAQFVSSVDDVLSSLGLPPIAELPVASARRPAGASAAVFDALGDSACHIDEVAASCGITGAAVLSALLELELDGWVRQLPGKRFARQHT